MKIFGWTLIVIWTFALLSLLSNIISGTSVDVFTDLIGIVFGVLQITFNYKMIEANEK